jgi:hypothetical protein
VEKDGTAVADGGLPYERLREVQGWRVIEEEKKGGVEGGGGGECIRRRGPHRVYSDLKRAPPPPPRMMALIKSKNRSAYSPGGTGLILCCTNIMINGSSTKNK